MAYIPLKKDIYVLDRDIYMHALKNVCFYLIVGINLQLCVDLQ